MQKRKLSKASKTLAMLILAAAVCLGMRPGALYKKSTAPADAPIPSELELLKGSFFQIYTVDGYDAGMWEAELQYMKDAKVDDHIVFQWTV